MNPSKADLLQIALRAQFGKGVDLPLMKAILVREQIAETLKTKADPAAEAETIRVLGLCRQRVMDIQAKLALTMKGGDIAASEEIQRHEKRYQKWLASERRTLTPKATIIIQAVMHLGDSSGKLPTVAEVEELIRAVIAGKGDYSRRKAFIASIQQIAQRFPGNETLVAELRSSEWKCQDWVRSNFKGVDLQVRRTCKEWGIPLSPGK